jgi:hypothetical protein
MTTILSTPTVVTIAAPGTSELATLAASMSAGTWAQLSVSNQNASLGVGAVSGSMIHYCNSMPWNSRSKSIEIIGEDHNWGSLRFVRYDEASNQFVLTSGGLAGFSGPRHGYDHQALNPYTGDLYMYKQGGGATPVGGYKNTFASPTSFTELPSTPSSYTQIAVGATWWSGSFAGTGAQGAFMVFNSGDSFGNANDGQIAAYNPLTNSWFFNKHGMAPYYSTSGNTYHSVMEYSAVKNVAVYGGGNDQPNKLWRLNADGSFTAMPNVPSSKGVGIQRGNLVCDPATGNFLVLSAGQLWELNPSGSGSWTQLSGSRTPPAGVGVPSNPDGIISSAIAEYGVVAYITQSSTTGGTFFLYKHA